MQLNLLLFSPICRSLLMHAQDLEHDYGWNLDNLDVYCPNLEVLKLPEGFRNWEL